MIFLDHQKNKAQAQAGKGDNMTREESISMLYGMRADNLNINDAYTKDKYEALDMAIKALEQELCGKDINAPATDAISRQAAIDACLNGWNKDYKEIVKDIRTLPPVTPQIKQEPCGKDINVPATDAKSVQEII